MRRFLTALLTAVMASGVVAVLTAPAGAQTGNLTAFCNARVGLDPALQQGKKAGLAVLDQLVANAPAAVATPVGEIRDAYKKKGEKAFDSVMDQIAVADSFIYDNCPGVKVPVTAIDYQYQGMPATMKPGVT